MPDIFDGANEITIKDIEDYLNSDGAETPAASEEGNQEPQPVKNETQAFAHRLKEATSKARAEERDNIAKSLGYESYEAMQKQREQNLLKEKGYDPEELQPVVEELVQKRLAEDPRMKELDSYRQKQAEEWAKKELTELKELTHGKITKLDDVPKEVIELWKTKGSLKGAYLELKGEELIREISSDVARAQNSGSTGHLQSPQGGTAPNSNGDKRPFTEQEKQIYKMFNPDVTDEQLSKMTKTI